jgi:lipid-binding SYLF domain-containing protein
MAGCRPLRDAAVLTGDDPTMDARRTSSQAVAGRRTAVVAILMFAVAPAAAWADDRADLERNARAALQQLYASTPKAAALGTKAQAVLVFPKIVKAGLMVGGQSGSGVLFRGGNVAGYYRISAGSFGLQAGAQTFSYALFFMTPPALAYLQKSNGWSIGSGPSVVVVDKGAAKTMNTTTVGHDVYALPFGQHGLMGGLGLEGSKISPIHPG